MTLEQAAQIDVIADVRQQMEERMSLLKPYHDEYEQIGDALARLNANAQPAKYTQPSDTTRFGPRPGVKHGDTKAAALQAVIAQPGSKTSEIGALIGMPTPNYLHKLLPQLEAEGTVRSEKRNKKAVRWYPA